MGDDTLRAPFAVDGRAEGAASPDGRVAGCYLHGIFASDAVRGAWLARIAGTSLPSSLAYDEAIDGTLDALAEHLQRHLDIDALLDIAKSRLPAP
jgi:adenosylcobyric acid synthase